MSWTRYFLPRVSDDLATAELTACSTTYQRMTIDTDGSNAFAQLLAVTTNLPLVPRMCFSPLSICMLIFFISIRFRKTSPISEPCSWLVSFHFGSAISQTASWKWKRKRRKLLQSMCFVILEGEDYFENFFVGKESLCTRN